MKFILETKTFFLTLLIGLLIYQLPLIMT